jgi:hypothetical protein
VGISSACVHEYEGLVREIVELLLTLFCVPQQGSLYQKSLPLPLRRLLGGLRGVAPVWSPQLHFLYSLETQAIIRMFLFEKTAHSATGNTTGPILAEEHTSNVGADTRLPYHIWFRVFQYAAGIGI